jgi:hypothetical protein
MCSEKEAFYEPKQAKQEWASPVLVADSDSFFTF